MFLVLTFSTNISLSSKNYADNLDALSSFNTDSSQIHQLFTVLGDFRNNTVFCCTNGFDFESIAIKKGGTVQNQSFHDFSLNPQKYLSGNVKFHKMYFINTFHLLENKSDVLTFIKASLRMSGECYFIHKIDMDSKQFLQNSAMTTEDIVKELKEHHFHYITVDKSSIDGYSLIRIDNYADPCDH